MCIRHEIQFIFCVRYHTSKLQLNEQTMWAYEKDETTQAYISLFLCLKTLTLSLLKQLLLDRDGNRTGPMIPN